MEKQRNWKKKKKEQKQLSDRILEFLKEKGF